MATTAQKNTRTKALVANKNDIMKCDSNKLNSHSKMCDMSVKLEHSYSHTGDTETYLHYYVPADSIPTLDCACVHAVLRALTRILLTGVWPGASSTGRPVTQGSATTCAETDSLSDQYLTFKSSLAQFTSSCSIAMIQDFTK